MPSLKCQCSVFLVKRNRSGYVFPYLLFMPLFLINAPRENVARNTGTGRKLMRSRRGRDCAERRVERKCVSLNSLAAVRHNTIRLQIVFSSPSAHLISALARLFSFICFIPLYCHNVADPECSHRSLVQLISEVVPLQIGSLNLVSLHSFSGLHFQGKRLQWWRGKINILLQVEQSRVVHGNLMQSLGTEGRKESVFAVVNVEAAFLENDCPDQSSEVLER